MYSDRGEDCPLHPLEFSLQSGTGIVGDVYLAMYDLEPNDVYLNVAKDVGEALIAVQDEKNGGFYYDGRSHEDGSGFQPHPRNERRTNVLDDNVMQSAMSFLLSLYNVTGENKYLESLNKGFDLLFEIEKEGGGWPQRTNYMENEYQSYITLNDDSMEDIFNLMLKAHEILGDEKYMNAAKRVGRFLIRVQGNGGSEFQQAWAQQYQNDQPAWARVFEPKSMCSKQTANGIEMLMELYLITGNATYLEPIPAAINWLNSSQTIIPLTDNPGEYGWSRLYELETNKPIVGNRNNWGNNVDYYYDYDPERDYGYSWEGTYGINTTLSNYAKLLELNNNTQQYLNWREQIQFNSFANEPDSETETLSEEGFWIDEDDGLIHSSTFVSKAMKYINYFTYLTEAD